MNSRGRTTGITTRWLRLVDEGIRRNDKSDGDDDDNGNGSDDGDDNNGDGGGNNDSGDGGNDERTHGVGGSQKGGQWHGIQIIMPNKILIMEAD